MKISNLTREQQGPNARISATVAFEESSRAPVDVYFQVPVAFEDMLATDANPFLVAAFVPALENKERRIAIDGEICPRLRQGLLTVEGLFRSWFFGERTPIAIEARMSSGRTRTAEPRAGAFFTGGIDSLATLRRNRLLFPKSHPESIRDLILVYGINFDSDDSPDTFARAFTELSAVARATDANLVPVTTNARRDLNPEYSVFMQKYHGGLLAATAQSLSGRLSAMSIGSTHDIPDLMPWGSHPLVDPNYSSFDMRIYHDCLDLSRFAKTQLVADWQEGLDNIKVCTGNWPGTNCSKCEKCMRTMLALEALGVLSRSASFSVDRIDAETVRQIQIFTANQASFYGQLVGPLRQVGRTDLADAIDFLLVKQLGEIGLRGQFRRFDRVYFDGGLRSFKKNAQAQIKQWLSGNSTPVGAARH